MQIDHGRHDLDTQLNGLVRLDACQCQCLPFVAVACTSGGPAGCITQHTASADCYTMRGQTLQQQHIAALRRSGQGDSSGAATCMSWRPAFQCCSAAVAHIVATHPERHTASHLRVGDLALVFVGGPRSCGICRAVRPRVADAPLALLRPAAFGSHNNKCEVAYAC